MNISPTSPPLPHHFSEDIRVAKASNVPLFSLDHPPAPKVTPFFETLRSLCQQAWLRLCEISPLTTKSVPQALFSNNAPNLACNEATHIKTIDSNQALHHHANRIKTTDQRPSTLAQDRVHIVGANPTNNEFTIAIANAQLKLKGDQHIVQFCSPNRFNDSQRIKATVLEQIASYFNTPDNHLAGYKPIDSNDAITKSTLHDNNIQSICFKLIKESSIPGIPPAEITLHITLAAPDFSKGYISSDDLINVYKHLDSQMEPDTYQDRQRGPTFLSKSGIGRSAALMTLFEVIERHKTEPFESVQAMQSSIDDIIQDGRRDRNPHFVHNQQQYHAIVEAATRLLFTFEPDSHEAGQPENKNQKPSYEMPLQPIREEESSTDEDYDPEDIDKLSLGTLDEIDPFDIPD